MKKSILFIISLLSTTPTREYGVIPLLVAAGAMAAGAIANGVNKKNLASEQDKRAKKLIADSQNIKREKEDEIFQENKDIALKKLGLGLPAKNIYEDQIKAQTADMIGQSRLATTSSGDLLSAAAAINKNANNSLLALAEKDFAYKDDALNEVSLNNQRIAMERARLESIAEQRRSQLRGQAGALETASTQNDYGANEDFIGAVTNSVASVAGGVQGQKNFDKLIGSGALNTQLNKLKLKNKLKDMKAISNDIVSRSLMDTGDVSDLQSIIKKR
jgi:hypothetical protein